MEYREYKGVKISTKSETILYHGFLWDLVAV